MTSHYGWVKCYQSGETGAADTSKTKPFSNPEFLRARLGTSRLVTLDMPEALSERVMNALKADPHTVDLRALAPNFYSLSERILELFEEEDMVDVLSDVCLHTAPEPAARTFGPHN